MRNLIIFIVFLIISFFINVVFYYVSPEYKDFIKNFKEEKILKSENEDIEEKTDPWTVLVEEDESMWLVKNDNKNNEIFDKINELTNKVQIKENVVLWKNYRDILSLFSSYNLQELEINTSLFDVTTEYPDNYIEYYSKELTLYFFPTKTYSQVYDIFKVLEYELPFNINSVNNFWDKSFYINLDNDINDNIIRIVISYKWISFWIKTKKNEYSLIKEKLNSLNTPVTPNTESESDSENNLEPNKKENE